MNGRSDTTAQAIAVAAICYHAVAHTAGNPVAGGAAPLLTSLSPWPLKILVDQALGGKPAGSGTFVRFLPHDKKELILLGAGASVLLFVAGSLVEAASTWLWSLAGQRMVRQVQCDLFSRAQRLSPTFHAKHSVGDLLSRLSGDAWCVYTLFDGLLLTPWQNLAMLLWMGVLAWMLDPMMTMLALAVAPALALTALVFGPRIKRARE